MRILKIFLVLVLLGLLGVGGFLGYAYYLTQQGIAAYARQLQDITAKSGGQIQLQYTATPVWYKLGVVAVQGIQATLTEATKGIVATTTQPDALVTFNLWDASAPVVVQGQSGPFGLIVSSTGGVSGTPALHMDMSGTLGTWKSTWMPHDNGELRNMQFDMQTLNLNRIRINHGATQQAIEISMGSTAFSSTNPQADYSKMDAKLVLRQLAVVATSGTQSVRFGANELGLTRQPFVAASAEGKTEYYANGLSFEGLDMPAFTIDRAALTSTLGASLKTSSATTALYKHTLAIGPIKSKAADKPVPVEDIRCTLAMDGVPMPVVDALQQAFDAFHAADNNEVAPEHLQHFIAAIRPVLRAPLILTLEDCSIRGMGANAEATLQANLNPGMIESLSGSVVIAAENPMVLGMMGMFAPDVMATATPVSGTVRFDITSADGMILLNASPTMALPTWDVEMVEGMLDAALQDPSNFAQIMSQDDVMTNPTEIVSGTAPISTTDLSFATFEPNIAKEINLSSTDVVIAPVSTTQSAVSLTAFQATVPTTTKANPAPKPKPKTPAPDQWLVPGIEDNSTR